VPAHHVEVRRGAVDLAPTVLSLYGLPLPTGEQRLSGQSLLDDVVRPAGYVPDARPVFIDMSEGPFNEERRAVIADDIKLIMSNGRTIGLYDLGQDPAELVDRRDDHELVTRSRAAFVAFQRQLRWVPVKPP
jgi:arylsulfatase A-like enzyme